MKTKKILIGVLVSSTCLLACNKGGFKKDDSGLLYKIVKDKEGKTAEDGDLLMLNFSFKTDKDSTFFSTKQEGGSRAIPVSKPTYKGGIEDGLKLLSEGDSAVFKLPVDSFFTKTLRQPLPKFVKAGTFITMDVKVEKIMKKSEVEKERAKQMEEMKKMSEEGVQRETQMLDEYLKKNNVKVSPLESGIYVVVNKPGKGSQPVIGKKVKLDYTGKFLDGKEFDSSKGKQPLEFTLGEGGVIPGMEQGVLQMKEGEKATLIIPSKMAYGDRGVGEVIPPFSPLVFEVELLSIK